MARKRRTDYPETLTVKAIDACGTRQKVCDAINRETGLNVSPTTVSKWLKVGGLPVGSAPAYARPISRLARKNGLKVTTKDLMNEAIVPPHRIPQHLKNYL